MPAVIFSIRTGSERKFDKPDAYRLRQRLDLPQRYGQRGVDRHPTQANVQRRLIVIAIAWF